MSGSSSEIVIRPALKEDCRQIQHLIKSLAEFEKFPDGPKLTIEDLERDGFESSPERFKCFVAESPSDPTTLCGFTMYFPVYSAWEGKALAIEDLYVVPELRGTGLGKRLLSHVAKVALIENYCRVQWHALGWNPACNFYKHIGAENVTESEDRTMWRLFKDGMEKLAPFAS